MKNVEEIKTLFTQMIINSQGYKKDTKLDFTKLFNDWEKNKEYFYKAFGNNYIYSTDKEISFELDKDAKEDKLKRFLKHLQEDYVWTQVQDADLGSLYYFLKDCKKDFFSNVLSESHVVHIRINNNIETITIPRGMKIIKAFKYFIKEKTLLNDLQNKASMIIQESKIKGYLCLSIHPLDYLTISENGYNWRSCHALNGSFRSGNLNYMADSCTVICYLCSDKLIDIYGIPWTNKKWRVLLFMSEGQSMIFAGRQYPFESSNILEAVHDKLLNIFLTGVEDKVRWAKWDNKERVISKYNNIDLAQPHYFVDYYHGFIKLQNIIKENLEPNYYNDLLKSSTYLVPYYTVKETQNLYGDYIPITDYRYNVFIGKDVNCPVCGKTLVWEESFVCKECTEKIEYEGVLCSFCNTVINEENAIILNGEILCQECANDYTVVCPRCNQLRFIDEYNPKDRICDHCLKKEKKENGQR